jgi:hypothetical protein
VPGIEQHAAVRALFGAACRSGGGCGHASGQDEAAGGHRFTREQTRSGRVGVRMSLPLIGFICFGPWRVVLMRVAVVVTIAVIVRMGFGDFAPGAEIHPHGEREDHRGGGEVEVRLGVLRVPLPAVMQGQRGEHPDEQRV